MKVLAITAAIALGAASFGVNAQTCASPTPLGSNLTIPNGSTCTGNAGLDMGGATIPHQYIVYGFTYQDDGDADAAEPDEISVTGTDMNAIISTDCSTAPMGGAASGTPYSVEGLTPGTSYVVVVTTSPGVPVPAGGPICGDFTLTTETLPVELQSISVD